MSRLHKILHWIFTAIYIGLFITTGWKYNHASPEWIRLTGWGLIAIGTYIIVRASGQRRDVIIKEKNKHVLVTSGLYSFVRHPEYLGHIILITGLMIISLHWLPLMLGSIMIIFLIFAILDEDRIMREAFREKYSDYANKVPMINIFAGIINKLKHK